ncbi:hypothetical protein DSAG12_02582 [Promethearchaeum syntrophicum]|uniref:Transglutaminase-like superfamily protein n=1 Tax=Promethearchaeum syntrophicum TaxID=2594042 RepID=A0A5B9DCA0_9ARCH|nr:hypothetical protein [Candidatus Prometheoarchaeum syntrophicum]QEE16752.1 hypothetical protein DSAG12_02582 [Candidatus Prometheoarchaeum syntrophicum]
MDSYELLPHLDITPSGEICSKFLGMNIKTFQEACNYVHNLDYGYNSDTDDRWILFKELKGSCTPKHGVIAGLAEELQIPLYKNVGIYKFTEKIVKGAQKIIEKYKIPFIPMVHCFLEYNNYRFDLTEGNDNGKETSIEEFMHKEQVEPFISRKNEYLLYRRVLEEKLLLSPEFAGISLKIILKAREEAILLLHEKVKK